MIFATALVMSTGAQAFTVPPLTGPVVDQAALLSSREAADLSKRLHEIKNAGTAQIQILILESLNDEPIEQVAIQTFDRWKIGDQTKDDGVLFITSVKDRKLRIEVGQGLEGAIPDVIAKRIISEITRPLYRTQNYYAGIVLTVEALRQAALTNQSGEIFNIDQFKEQLLQNSEILNQQERRSLQEASSVDQKGTKKVSLGKVMILLIILWFIILLISPSTALWILYAIMSSSGRGGGYGGGRGGGFGGWSGGGGSSSGGGASGDW